MKNSTHTLFSRIFFTAFFISSFVLHMPLNGAAQVQPTQAPAPFYMGNGGQDRMPTQEELAAMEQQLKEEFERAYASLSIEEKKEVDAYMERISKMSDEELFEHIEEEFEKLQKEIDHAKKQDEQIPPASTPTPQVPAPVDEKMVEPERIIPPCKETNNIVDLINTLIHHTNSFMLKASMIPDFNNIVHRFVAQKSAKGSLPKNMSWALLKEKIESFQYKLHVMLEKDPQNKQYRSINAFGDNTTLCNNLNRLRSTLEKYEARIEAPKFGLGEISITTKRAIDEVLEGYIEALFSLDIPQALDKVIQTYEPRAKKLSEQEEAARKKAFEESKKFPTSKPVTVVRTRESGRYSPVEPSYPHHGGGYDHGDYNPYYPSNYPEYPGGHEPVNPNQKPKPNPKPKPKPSEKEEKEEIIKKKKEEAQKAPIEILKEIDNNVTSVATTLSNPLLSNIYQHMKSAEPKNDTLAKISLPHAIKRTKNAITAIKTMKRRLQTMPKKNKAEAEQELRATVAPRGHLFDAFIKQVEQVKADKSIEASKREAYQKNLEELAKQLQQLKKEIGVSEPKKQEEDDATRKAKEKEQAEKQKQEEAEKRAAERQERKKKGSPTVEPAQQGQPQAHQIPAQNPPAAANAPAAEGEAGGKENKAEKENKENAGEAPVVPDVFPGEAFI